MKFNVLQENLKNLFSYLQKVIPTKPQITVLSSILLQVKNKKLISLKILKFVMLYIPLIYINKFIHFKK